MSIVRNSVHLCLSYLSIILTVLPDHTMMLDLYSSCRHRIARLWHVIAACNTLFWCCISRVWHVDFSVFYVFLSCLWFMYYLTMSYGYNPIFREIRHDPVNHDSCRVCHQQSISNMMSIFNIVRHNPQIGQNRCFFVILCLTYTTQHAHVKFN